jgi:hypothetical protein
MRKEADLFREKVQRLLTPGVGVLVTVYYYDNAEQITGMETFANKHKVHQAGCGLTRRWIRAQETVFNELLMNEE